MNRPRSRVFLGAAGAFGLGLLVALLIGVLGSSGDPERPTTARGTTIQVTGGRSGDDPAQAAGGLSGAEQVAQLFVVGVPGTALSVSARRLLRSRPWGGVLLGSGNYTSPSQLRELTSSIERAARTASAVEPLLGAPQAGGEANAFAGLPPERSQGQEGLAARPARVRAEAQAAGRALRRAGLNMTLAPSADVGTTAGGLGSRVFADDPDVVSRLAVAALDGYRRAGVIAAVGQFPGAGASSQDPAVGTASVGLSLEELRRRDLRPFDAVAERAPVVLVSNAVYAAFDGVTPAILLRQVVGDLLRKDLGFRGVVLSDDLVTTAEVGGVDVGAAAVTALRAGADLLYVPGGPREQERAYASVLRAYQQGGISTQRLRESVVRVLALKRIYGLRIS